MSRPKTFPFFEFMEQASNDTLPSAVYVRKYDGFRFKFFKGEDSKNLYFSKNSKTDIKPPPKDKRPANILEAIVLYIESNPVMIKPGDVLYGEEIPASGLDIEFCAYSLSDKAQADDLQLLYHKKCLDPKTGRLDEEKYGYRINVFDARFKKEDGDDQSYLKRLDSINLSIARMDPQPNVNCAEQIFNAEQLMQTLLDTEGVVCHRIDGEIFKIKLPRYIVKARILAVADTTDLEGFKGFSRFVFGVPSGKNTWSVIHVSDMTELLTDFDRPKQGRAFIPPQSIKFKNGGLVCEGRFTLQKLMNALHQSVSKVTKLPPTSFVSSRKVVVAHEGVGNAMIKVGDNRRKEMNFIPEDRFLTKEVNVTLGCSELWALKDGDEVHLQPAMIVGVNDLYGPKEYNEIEEYTPLSTLRRIALVKPNPIEAYRMVGMKTGPFLGLEDKFISSTPDCKLTTEHSLFRGRCACCEKFFGFGAHT